MFTNQAAAAAAAAAGTQHLSLPTKFAQCSFTQLHTLRGGVSGLGQVGSLLTSDSAASSLFHGASRCCTGTALERRQDVTQLTSTGHRKGGVENRVVCQGVCPKTRGGMLHDFLNLVSGMGGGVLWCSLAHCFKIARKSRGTSTSDR